MILKLISQRYIDLVRSNLWQFALILLGLIFILQWAFAYEQLIAVWDLGPEFIPQFLVDGYIAFFMNIIDFIPITITLIALFQALALLGILRIRQKPSAGQAGSYGVALIASGCVACGSSLLAPVLASIGAAASTSAAAIISQSLLLIALALAIISWYITGKKLLKGATTV